MYVPNGTVDHFVSWHEDRTQAYEWANERVMRQRREWYRMYQCGELTLGGLRKKAPLIAAAVERAGP